MDLAQGEYRETFERNAGWRLNAGDRSLLIQALSVGARLSRTQKAAYVRTMFGYLNKVAGTPPLPRVNPRPLAAEDFPTLRDESFFRFVTPVTLDHIKRGSFRVGTPSYYRKIEDEGRADGLEGHAAVFLEGDRKTLAFLGVAGFNCATLSGISVLPKDRRTLRDLRQKFGSQLIEICDVNAFASLLAERSGAFRYRLSDVKYIDGKYMSIKTSALDGFIDITGTGDLTKETLHQVNVSYWTPLYDHIMLPSVFSKPVRYSFERERRLMLEFPSDVTTPFITIVAPKAAKLIRLLD